MKRQKLSKISLAKYLAERKVPTHTYISLLRKNEKISLINFSQMLRLSYGYYRKLEKGDFPMKYIYYLRACNLLGIDFDIFTYVGDDFNFAPH